MSDRDDPLMPIMPDPRPKTLPAVGGAPLPVEPTTIPTPDEQRQTMRTLGAPHRDGAGPRTIGHEPLRIVGADAASGRPVLSGGSPNRPAPILDGPAPMPFGMAIPASGRAAPGPERRADTAATPPIPRTDREPPTATPAIIPSPIRPPDTDRTGRREVARAPALRPRKTLVQQQAALTDRANSLAERLRRARIAAFMSLGGALAGLARRDPNARAVALRIVKELGARERDALAIVSPWIEEGSDGR